ncbi:dicarboxylate transporter/tellurite-resistance protein TehA [Deinococcus pimensis]|uniref:dicarboxylate transporter/tellurite-resistance protein TehA n=1 Tax=Deinococcus pimensis TaxID=309888 RepID=UPI0005EB17F1|nr:dicarboxylate transporter/tellurite-resistance protein TehA [Deinococcus pimensis]
MTHVAARTSIRSPNALPSSLFALVLGLAGLGNAWRAARTVWPVPHVIGELFELLAAIVFVTLLAGYLPRLLRARSAERAELHHPLQASYVALVPVSTLLMALAALPYQRTLALALFTLGALGALGYGVYRYGSLWLEDRADEQTTSALYLPTVAASFVTANAAGALGHVEIGWLFFGVGTFTWLALESVILQRLLTRTLPPALRPSLGIHLAPPVVGAAAYLSLTDGRPDVFVQAMVGYGIFVALTLLRLAPWLNVTGFAASYWSYTFGATALAYSLIRLHHAGLAGVYGPLAVLALIAANVVVVGCALLTVRLWWQGRLVPNAAPPTGTLSEST